MNNQKNTISNQERVLTKIIQIGSMLVPFSLLLVGNNFFFPYIHLKNVFFRVLVSVLLFLTIWLIWERGFLIGKNNYILYTWFFLVVILFIAALFGVNFQNSFYSDYERMDGIINIIWLGIYLFILLQVFNNKQSWLNLLSVYVLIAFLISLIGWLQKAGVESRFIPGEINDRMSATIGNSAYMAGYILFHFFFTLFLFYFSKKMWQRVFYIALSLFFILTIYSTGTRGSFLGLIIGILIILFFSFFKVKKNTKILILAGLALFFSLSGFIYTQKNSQWVQNSMPLRRLTSISLHDSTVNNRLYTWQSAWHAFLDRPIFGYGLENFRYAFNRYYEPRNSEPWFDRAHNFIFDYLIAGGILGLIAYLLLVGTIVFSLIKIKKYDYWIFVIGLGTLIAYLVHNFFVFDTLSTYLSLILFLGLIGFVYFLFINKEEEWPAPGVNLKFFVLIGSFVFLVLINYFFIARPAKANVMIIKASRKIEIGKQYAKLPIISEKEDNSLKYYRQAFDLFKQALALNTYGNREITLQMINFGKIVAGNKNIPDDFVKEIVKETEKNAEIILAKNPDDIQFRMVFLGLYFFSMNRDKTYWDKSQKLLTPILEYSPHRLETYYSLAQLYIIKSDYATALDYLQQAFAIDDKKDSNYVNLLNFYAHTNKIDEFNKLADEYVNKMSLAPERWVQLAMLYQLIGSAEKAETIIKEKVINKNSLYEPGYMSLLSLYKENKEYDKAIELIYKMKDILPDFDVKGEQLIKYFQIEQAQSTGTATSSDK